MKKIIMIVLSLILIFAFCGCSQSGETSNGSDSLSESVSKSSSSSNSQSESKNSQSSKYSSNSQTVSSSGSTSTSSSTSSLLPSGTKTETFLNGTLYGDSNFIAKMKTANQQSAVPSDAIYVALNGNDNNSGTLSSPLRTLQKAISIASNNIAQNKTGNICVRGGTYSETADLIRFYDFCGKQNSYINIIAYPNETPVFSANGGDTGIIHLGSSSFVSLDGISVVGKTAVVDMAGINFDESNHIIIKNCTIKNIKTPTPTKTSAFPLVLLGSNTAKSINNVLIYKTTICDCNSGWSEALEVVSNCENINIIENTIKNTGNIGIDIGGNFGYCSNKALDQARNVVVRGNNVSECKSSYATSYAIYVDGARDVLVENNYAYNSLGGIEIGSERNVIGYPVTNITIRNNVVFGNTEHALAIGGFDPEGKESVDDDGNAYSSGCVENVKVYNNTFVSSVEDGEVVAFSYLKNVEIKNNIFYSSSSGAVVYAGGVKSQYIGAMSFANNAYYFVGLGVEEITFVPSSDKAEFDGLSNWVNYSHETGSVYKDPKFTDITKNDYSLSAQSQLVGAGLSLSVGDYDVLGYSRIVGVLDIGAFERQN